MKANYPNCYKITRAYEGGNDDDPRDPGGRTSRGVIQREYDLYRISKGLPKRDVWSATEDEIADIYRENYWDKVLGDQWPEGADLVVWDCAVHSGPARSAQFARELIPGATTFGAMAATCRATADKTPFIKKFCAMRLSFLKRLKIWSYYARGFTNRVTSVEANGVRMALAAAKLPHDEIKKQLDQESKAAATEARKTSTGAAGTSGAAGGGVTQVDWHGMDWAHTLLTVAVIAGLTVLAVYLVHLWLVHRARAKAYAEVASATGG